MAKLGKNYPFPKRKDFNDWREYDEASMKAFRELPEDRLLKFSIADGYAYYIIESLQPLVLNFVPCFDEYNIPMPYVRGLTKEDVEGMLEMDVFWNSLLTEK